MEVQDFVMPNVPEEVWELICGLCEDEILYTVLPLVSKRFRNILHDEESIWKQRCVRKNLDLSSKTENKSWKQYYRRKYKIDTWNLIISYLDGIRLFPLCGITIRQTTFQDILVLRKTNRSILVDDKIKAAKLKDHEIMVWCRLHENGKFNCVSSITGFKRGKELPEAWVKQGINWSKSLNEYKELLTNWTQNCKLIDEGWIIDSVDKTATNYSLESEVKESDGEIYTIILSFKIESLKKQGLDPNLYEFVIAGLIILYIDTYDTPNTLVDIKFVAKETGLVPSDHDD